MFQFDVIVFNPPYVPTDDDELQRALTKHDISASWAGGKDGREVIDRFLKSLNLFLSETGVAYLLLLEANKIVEVMQMAEGLGLSVYQLMKRRAGIETLYILRIKKRVNDDS
ncbi:methyltransferase [Gracilaria domingensis]|nr:methyltransferase [Gracilaria domingensis]